MYFVPDEPDNSEKKIIPYLSEKKFLPAVTVLQF